MPAAREKRLTIPVEILSREFDAKLLLACFAAESGFSVIIGSKREIHVKMGSLPRSIYFAMNLTDRNLAIYELLNKLGHSIVAADEEAVVYYSPETYRKAKIGPTVFQKALILFAWGPENARVWRDYSDYRGTPIHITGHPRADLLRSELRDFWSDEAHKIRKRFGRFILINSNFGKLNHYRPGESEQHILHTIAAGSRNLSDFDAGVVAHRYALFQGFQEMIAALAKAHLDLAIVVRPHPSENHETWRKAAGDCSNVHVVHEGSVIPWLLASEVMIHNGCTTGVEAYLLGVPAIAYRPVASERFDLHLPNNLSHQAFDLEGLQQLVEASLRGSFSADQSTWAEQRNLIGQYIASIDGSLACEKIVETIDASVDMLRESRAPGLVSLLEGQAQALYRRLTRQYNASFATARNRSRYHRYQYHRHIFPAIDLPTVGSRIARFHQILNRFSRIKAREVSYNIFEITCH